ncbi:Hypothetical predicted protein [Podarcis lilfordi]|uniref:Uncharacterized protein n=1 Tax=Podarcis lilfordi TaxID=74358 RepID=A0AA35LCQ3_9SAUR|nr:Hypothetical predicted protein [Podarcis lilfordi]
MRGYFQSDRRIDFVNHPPPPQQLGYGSSLAERENNNNMAMYIKGTKALEHPVPVLTSSKLSFMDIKSASAEEAEKVKWEKQDRKARTEISIYVSDSDLHHIRNVKTAKELWQGLKELYERNSLNERLYLSRKLFNLK